jgi:hypothetical protein
MDDQALFPPEDSHFDTSLVRRVQTHGKARARVGVTEPPGLDFAPFLHGLGTKSLIGSNIGKVTGARSSARIVVRHRCSRLAPRAGNPGEPRRLSWFSAKENHSSRSLWERSNCETALNPGRNASGIRVLGSVSGGTTAVVCWKLFDRPRTRSIRGTVATGPRAVGSKRALPEYDAGEHRSSPGPARS